MTPEQQAMIDIHIKQSDAFLDSVCVANGLTREEYTAMSKEEKIALIAKQIDPQ